MDVRTATCRDLDPLTAGYLEALLSPDLAELYERHLVFCGDCRVNVGRLRAAGQAVAALPRIDPPPDLLAALEHGR